MLSAGTTAREPTIVSDCTPADGWRRLRLAIDRLRKRKTVWQQLETQETTTSPTSPAWLRRLHPAADIAVLGLDLDLGKELF